MARSSALHRERALLAALALVLSATLSGCLSTSDNDHDGILDGDDPDDDNDGMPDTFEVAAGLNPLDASDAALDADHDGLSNAAEFSAHTDPRVADSDNDTMPDGFEVRYGLDPRNASDGEADLDHDGLTNRREAALNSSPTAADSDLDGMPDLWEADHALSPTSAADASLDADLDGLSNAAEFAHGSDPNRADSDSDGMPDAWEVHHGLSPADPADAALDGDSDSYDANLNGTIDPEEAFTNLREFAAGSDPGNADTDGDHIPDGYEWLCGLLPLDPTDALLDADHDGVSNLNESAASTAANRNDTDLDGMGDGFELQFGLDPRDPSDAATDGDLDGLTNLAEARAHGDPRRNDTDGDGVLDGADADPARNLTLVFTLTFVNITFAPAPSESGFDPPWELSLSVTVAGVALGPLNFTLQSSTPDTGESASLSLSVAFDVFDGAPLADLSLVLLELDLAETIGVNADDTIDLDPTGADTTLSFSVSLTSLSLSGETAAPTVDASQDGRTGESDGRITFTLSLESL
jgi:hypothetical protein